MNILAVDTAGKTAGVALLQDDRLLYEVYLDAGMTHSETLMPMIDTCLKMCGMTCADIDLYGVNAGPGSFTGLRIGLAAVKGLAFPRETLCAPVSTLEALAAAHTLYRGSCRGPWLHRPGVQPNLCHCELLPRPKAAGAL